MAKDQHIKWMLEGALEWNSRREHQNFTPDFEAANFLDIFRQFGDGTSLRTVELGGFNFSGANLRYANLEKSNLSGAEFVKADLRDSKLALARLDGADLQEATLDRADLGGGSLTSADLQEAHFSGAILREVNFHGAYFGATRFKGADMSHAQMEGADLGGTDLAGAIFVDANLEGAKFYGSDLTNVNFENANLRSADLREVKFKDTLLKGSNLRAVILSNADLSGADLRGAILLATNLSGANLVGADLRGANLIEADLSGAILNESNLSGLSFEGANLRMAKFERANVRTVIQELDRIPPYGTKDGRTDLSYQVELVQEQLEQMTGDNGTIIPKHLKRPSHWISLDNAFEPVVKKDPPAISSEMIERRLQLNGAALTFAVSSSIEQVAEYREKIRIDNELGATQPQHRDELIEFLDNLMVGLESLLFVVPSSNEMPDEEAVEGAVSWLQDFKETVVPEFQKYMSAENVGKATVPGVIIVGFGTIGAILTGHPFGFGAGSYVGKLLVGELKSGVVIDRLKNDFDGNKD